MITRALVFDSFLADGRALDSRLASMSAHGRFRDAFVGLQVGGQRLFAALEGGIRLDPGEAENHPVTAGCLTKPLTATLLAEAAWKHHLDWSGEINSALDLSAPWKDKLSGISLACLLNHTHGLDASAIPRVPRTDSGLVDVQSLCSQLASAPLSAPGRLYSYSNTGPWLAGALLERLSGQPYSHLLRARQFWPAGPGSNPVPGSICPATGEELQPTVSQWLAFVALHLRDPPGGPDGVPGQAMTSLLADPVPLPGWNPSERGACLGWKHYGASWFGHNSNAGSSSALLRFNPEQNIAIVIEASDDTAFMVLAWLFGPALPEFANLRPPRLLSSKERASLRLDHYTGTYVQAQSRLGVGLNSRGSLSLTVESQGARVAACLLRPAEGGIFIPESKIAPELAFIQLVEPEPTHTFRYLWNGKQLWRRE